MKSPDSKSSTKLYRGQRIVLIGVLWLAFALRAYHLDNQELRGDEAFGYFFSQQTLDQLVNQTLSLKEPHPVLSYILLNNWLKLAGASEYALRFLGVIFGVLAVALLYQLARKLGGTYQTGIIASLCLAVSAYAIWHSQDARMYSMSLALTLAGVTTGVAALQDNRWRHWGGYVAFFGLALQTHYFAFFVLLAFNLAAVVFLLKRVVHTEVGKGWLYSGLILALISLTWFIMARDTLATYHGNGDSPGFLPAMQRALAVFSGGESLPVPLRTVLAAVGGALLVYGLIRQLRAGQDAKRMALIGGCYLFTPLLLTWLSATRRPVFNERYLIAAIPPFWLLIATASRQTSWPSPANKRQLLHALTDRLALLGVIVLIAGNLFSLWNYNTNPAYGKTRGWRELSQALYRYSENWPVSETRLVQNFPDPTLWYYYDGPVAHLVIPPSAHDLAGAEREVAAMTAANVERVVLPVQPAEWWDNSNIARTALQDDFDLIFETSVVNWPVLVYQRLQNSMGPTSETFVNGLRITAQALPAQELKEGDVFPIYLKWDTKDAVLSGSEKLTLQLLNSRDQVVAQHDLLFSATQPRGDVSAYGLELPLSLPHDTYRLLLAVYDEGLANAPRLVTIDGADHLILAVLGK